MPRPSSATVSVVPDGVLAYGMQLPVQALSVRVSMPWEQEATVDDLVRVAQAADDAGFLYVAVCHHVAIPPEPAEMMSTQWYDPIATLGFLAAHTARTRLMTNVFIAAYQPALATAKAFATLDRLSNGRMIVGIGAGHVEGEFDALGVSFAGRGKLTDDALGDHLRRAHRRMDRHHTRGPRSANDRGRCNSPTRRSGSAVRASPPCGASRPWPTAGSRRPRRSTSCPATSPRSCASATRCVRARCRRSGITSSPTSGSPRGICRRA